MAAQPMASSRGSIIGHKSDADAPCWPEGSGKAHDKGSEYECRWGSLCLPCASKTLLRAPEWRCTAARRYSRVHERVQVAATNRMDRPTRRCLTIHHCHPAQRATVTADNKFGNVAQCSLATPRSRPK
ncbi:hypothetical protein J6590_081854 [Homalodisca vitripennis]|nr:hypothetical protein J6590_081854 [Homalodisca vitripennis]